MLSLAFVVNRHNLNSVAALTGALEAESRFEALPLHFVWGDEKAVSRLQTLSRESDPLIVA